MKKIAGIQIAFIELTSMAREDDRKVGRKDLESTPPVALVPETDRFIRLNQRQSKLFRTIKQTNRRNMEQEQKRRTCG